MENDRQHSTSSPFSAGAPSSGDPHSLISTIANASLAPFLISLSIGLPSSLFFMLQLFIIIKYRNREFKSSFFKLYAVRTIWSLIGFFGNFLALRFPRLGLFLSTYLSLPPLLLASFYFLRVHPCLAENVATAVLLLNRLTAIIFPFKYEKLWKWALPWTILLICIIPLPITLHMFWLDEFVRIQADNFTFTLDNPQRARIGVNGEPNDSQNTSVFNFVTTMVCLGINICCLFAYRQASWRRGQQQQQPQEGEQRRRTSENRLTICTILTFAGQALYTLYLILLYLTISQMDWLGICDPELGQMIFLAVYNQFPWVNDLCTIVIPALLLFWTSDVMQKRISVIMPFWKKQRVDQEAKSVLPIIGAWTSGYQGQQ